jgi:hypothetical protein
MERQIIISAFALGMAVMALIQAVARHFLATGRILPW